MLVQREKKSNAVYLTQNVFFAIQGQAAEIYIKYCVVSYNPKDIILNILNGIND